MPKNLQESPIYQVSITIDTGPVPPVVRELSVAITAGPHRETIELVPATIGTPTQRLNARDFIAAAIVAAKLKGGW